MLCQMLEPVNPFTTAGKPVLAGAASMNLRHALAGGVLRHRAARRPVVLRGVPAGLCVVLVLEAGVDVEVIAPARELDAVVADPLRLLADLFERGVGPLAGKQRDGTGHERFSFAVK